MSISDDEWNEAFSEVSSEIHITRVREDELSNNSLMFRKGCELMGFSKHHPNSRNCFSCMQCGLCHLGCHYETKQDMRVTYLHKALNNPRSNIKIYCNCSAERITHSGDTVDGVDGDFLDSSGNVLHKMRVTARLVVIAAGSIASTELLLKSSIAEGKGRQRPCTPPGSIRPGRLPLRDKGNSRHSHDLYFARFWGDQWSRGRRIPDRRHIPSASAALPAFANIGRAAWGADDEVQSLCDGWRPG